MVPIRSLLRLSEFQYGLSVDGLLLPVEIDRTSGIMLKRHGHDPARHASARTILQREVHARLCGEIGAALLALAHLEITDPFDMVREGAGPIAEIAQADPGKVTTSAERFRREALLGNTPIVLKRAPAELCHCWDGKTEQCCRSDNGTHREACGEKHLQHGTPFTDRRDGNFPSC
jgi:hypothetical protein